MDVQGQQLLQGWEPESLSQGREVTSEVAQVSLLRPVLVYMLITNSEKEGNTEVEVC